MQIAIDMALSTHRFPRQFGQFRPESQTAHAAPEVQMSAGGGEAPKVGRVFGAPLIEQHHVGLRSCTESGVFTDELFSSTHEMRHSKAEVPLHHEGRLGKA